MDKPDRELGPLEQEIDDAIRRKVERDSIMLEMLTGQFNDADIAALSPSDRQRVVAQVQARTLEAHREAILRLAREIDAINTSADGDQ